MLRKDIKPVSPVDSLVAAREVLANSIARNTDQEGQITSAIPALTLYRFEAPTQPVVAMYEPSIAMIAQGAKRVLLGDATYVHVAHSFLITSIDLPTATQVIEASPEKPYLSLLLKLDMGEVAQLMADSNLPPPPAQPSSRGMAISEASLPLLNAFQRLIDLLDEPKDIPILAPVIQREILYRLIVSDQGLRLRHIGSVGSQSHQIARAIDWMKEHFSQPLRMDDLAARFNMSISTFHHHFRALTAVSPLQFQKRLRLHEARRLMISENLDAAGAAFKVGYESPSQFSREYSRLFREPPLRDVTKLRQKAGAPL